jgi:hypothetical protein
MKSASLFTRKEGQSLDSPDLVRILIVYEDMVTGQKARYVAEQLVGSLGPNYKCETSLWKFEVLKVPDISAMAAYEARQADLIVFAAQKDKELDDEVKQWIQNWIPFKERGDSCIVALLLRSEGDPPLASPLYSYLSKVAKKSGLDFFWQELESKPQFFGGVGEESNCAMTHSMNSSAEMDRSVIHWGIND